MSKVTLKRRMWEIIALLGAIAVVFFSLACSFFLVMHTNLESLVLLELEDLAALLFGASSLALVLVSLAMAVAALFGWQTVQGSLENIAKRTADEMKSPLE